MKAEYWVMRVMISKESPTHELEMRLATRDRAVMAALESGALACVGGELVEPIACYDSPEDANAKAIEAHARTGQVHKVTLSMDV